MFSTVTLYRVPFRQTVGHSPRIPNVGLNRRYCIQTTSPQVDTKLVKTLNQKPPHSDIRNEIIDQRKITPTEVKPEHNQAALAALEIIPNEYALRIDLTDIPNAE